MKFSRNTRMFSSTLLCTFAKKKPSCVSMTNCCSCGHRSTRDWLCSHGLYNVGQTQHQHGCWACRTRPPCCDPGCGCTNDTIVCGKVRRVSHRCRRAPLPDLACPRPRQIPVYTLSYAALKTMRTTTSAIPFSKPPPPPLPTTTISHRCKRARADCNRLIPGGSWLALATPSDPERGCPRSGVPRLAPTHAPTLQREGVMTSEPHRHDKVASQWGVVVLDTAHETH